MARDTKRRATATRFVQERYKIMPGSGALKRRRFGSPRFDAMRLPGKSGHHDNGRDDSDQSNPVHIEPPAAIVDGSGAVAIATNNSHCVPDHGIVGTRVCDGCDERTQGVVSRLEYNERNAIYKIRDRGGSK